MAHPSTECQTSQTHCNTLQHTAAHCNTLQHFVIHCVTLEHTATHCNTLQNTPDRRTGHCPKNHVANFLTHTCTHANTRTQHTGRVLCPQNLHTHTHTHTNSHTYAHTHTHTGRKNPITTERISDTHHGHVRSIHCNKHCNTLP